MYCPKTLTGVNFFSISQASACQTFGSVYVYALALALSQPYITTSKENLPSSTGSRSTKTSGSLRQTIVTYTSSELLKSRLVVVEITGWLKFTSPTMSIFTSEDNR
jgi:hypothetical protein